jgi:DNA invertase Pin-like site-specific DNA recombinase
MKPVMPVQVPNDNPPVHVRAAQYVRMSTEHQKYSTENQSVVIQRYADQRGIEIVQTYADHGKSGLRIDGRAALKQLIADVRSGRSAFTAILVYDISRWGRFQDADESAYYEFLCKEAGIVVHYCAEQFENDGSLSATIIKSMKRAMAGEYSRELSVKVFTGQCRLISLGFRQGGLAGYGLRRVLVDENRQPKAELALGQHKSLQTDRVILVPGPPPEVETVRRIYRMFLEDARSEHDIAALLNRGGILTDLQRPWTRGTVHQVLTNEKYVGNNVYNRTSFKLKMKRVCNPPDMWIRANSSFEPVVDSEVFARVNAIIEKRSQRLSDDDLLSRLSALCHSVGSLSGLIIDERDNMPSSATYRSRFGSLLRAYTLIGYAPQRDYEFVTINRSLRAMHAQVVTDAVEQIRSLGGHVEVAPVSQLMTINHEFTVSLVISRCLELLSGAFRWNIRLDCGLNADITVAVRMDQGNHEALDYYLLPRMSVAPRKLRLREDNGLSLDAFRYDSLAALFEFAKRVPIGRAA